MDTGTNADVSSGSAAPGTEPNEPLGGVGVVLAGRYRLIERVGSGGMATIFRARDESLQRDVAVKILHSHLADDPAVQARFRTEARHAAGLLHPNIVTVFDQGVADVPFIVMELIDGPTLRHVLAEHGPMTAAEALEIIEPVCRALQRAHDADVIHRDVKPENVLLTADGTPKVADFGIARALAETSHTQTGVLVGSVHYMPPELVNGGTATPASDQYAVGVLLFELLTGRKPLPADSPMAVLLRHGRESLPATSEFNRSITPAVDAVVARATALDPEDRYPSVLALAQALREALTHGQRAAPPTRPITHLADDDTTAMLQPVAESPRHPRHRRSLMVLPALLVLLALLATGAWAAWNFALAPVQQVPPVIGLSQAVAGERLAELGFELEVTERRSDVDASPGEVLDQDPSPGSDLRRGSIVSVVVSTGPANVTMPRVVEGTEQAATQLLRGEPYFFDVRVDREHHDFVPAGQVAGQWPDEGETLEQGSSVIVNISLGIEQVTVPDLSGRNREEAQALLEEAKLQADFASEYSDAVPDVGAVISQSVEAGTTVDKGTVVRVVVSRGPLTIRMPNVERKPVDEARAQLEELGLRVRIVGQSRPRIGPVRQGQYGRVEYQEPAAGQPVKRGETVTLYTFTAEAEND